ASGSDWASLSRASVARRKRNALPLLFTVRASIAVPSQATPSSVWGSPRANCRRECRLFGCTGAYLLARRQIGEFRTRTLRIAEQPCAAISLILPDEVPHNHPNLPAALRAGYLRKGPPREGRPTNTQSDRFVSPG